MKDVKILRKMKNIKRCWMGPLNDADDFFWGGTKHFEERVINKLKEKLLNHLEELENFKYIGLNLVQNDDCVHLYQQLYVDNEKEVVFPKNIQMPKDTPLTTDEAQQLRKLAGVLNWRYDQTHPDVSLVLAKPALQ